MALWRVRDRGRVVLARGAPETGPSDLLDAPADLGALLASGADALWEVAAGPSAGLLTPGAAVLAPLDRQEVWAAGVTYLRSRDARAEETTERDVYDRVYAAERPELFFKAAPQRVRGPGQPVGIRRDSGWDVPEPELAVVLDSRGRIAAYTIGNDVSSRSIEGENPLYLPQAKVYTGSCALGPCLVPPQELDDPDALAVALTISRGGELVASGETSTAQLRRSPQDLADWLFRACDFPQGVVLLTGTGIVPPADVTLRAGDEITITVTGLGALTSTVEVVG